MLAPLPAVDVHAHVWLPEIHSMVEGRPGLAAHHELDLVRFGPEAIEVSNKSVAGRYELLVDPTARTAEMDRTGIDVQVVSVSPTQYHPWSDLRLAEDLAQATNESVAAHCAAQPGRLTGLGVVPLQHPDAAVAALEHAVLVCGLRGVEISSHALEHDAAGVIDLSDSRLERLWQRAAELGAVIFIHPWGCTLDARLNRWYLGNTVGQPVEHAIALSHLILSGVLDRHPRLRVLAAHGGGYLPTCLGRADFAWTHRVDARGCAESPSSYLQQIWFDSLVYTPDALRALVAATGTNQVLLGSDYPFDMGVDDALQRLEDAALEPDTVRAIRGGNAATLGLLPLDQ